MLQRCRVGNAAINEQDIHGWLARAGRRKFASDQGEQLAEIGDVQHLSHRASAVGERHGLVRRLGLLAQHQVAAGGETDSQRPPKGFCQQKTKRRTRGHSEPRSQRAEREAQLRSGHRADDAGRNRQEHVRRQQSDGRHRYERRRWRRFEPAFDARLEPRAETEKRHDRYQQCQADNQKRSQQISHAKCLPWLVNLNPRPRPCASSSLASLEARLHAISLRGEMAFPQSPKFAT